jgi:hypothetical protein
MQILIAYDERAFLQKVLICARVFGQAQPVGPDRTQYDGITVTHDFEFVDALVLHVFR